MTPFLYDASAQYRVERLREDAEHRRMAASAKNGAMLRESHSLRGALGNGLIALGERLAEPPSARSTDLNRAA